MVSNADIMHNGLIFNPYNGIPQRPHNRCLGTHCGSIMATYSPKTWYHCIQLCVYIMRSMNDSLVEDLNADIIHNGLVFDPQVGATQVPQQTA